MAASDSRPGVRGDEAELFRAFNDELMRVVAGAVRDASAQTIEDACAFAWIQFMHHQPDRDRNWQGWLFRTAQREAWALNRQARRHVGLRDSDREEIGGASDVDLVNAVQVREDVQDALELIGRLRPRLQRIALMRGLGLHHRDIAAITGDSRTRVAQLASQASQEIADMLATRRDSIPTSPRARRLRELESDPPDWLTERIGRMPPINRRIAGQTQTRRAWRRAALALDDLRCAVGADDFPRVLALPPRDGELRRYYDAASRALDELMQARSREMGRLIGE